jgi:hypothetical protein
MTVISEAFSTSSKIGFLKIRNTEDMTEKTFSTTTRALDSRWLKMELLRQPQIHKVDFCLCPEDDWEAAN